MGQMLSDLDVVNVLDVRTDHHVLVYGQPDKKGTPPFAFLRRHGQSFSHVRRQSDLVEAIRRGWRYDRVLVADPADTIDALVLDRLLAVNAPASYSDRRSGGLVCFFGKPPVDPADDWPEMDTIISGVVASHPFADVWRMVSDQGGILVTDAVGRE